MFHFCCQDTEVVPGNQTLYLESNPMECLTRTQVVTGIPSVFAPEVLADAGAGVCHVWG